MNDPRRSSRWLHPLLLRRVMQWGMLALCVWLGVRFGLFVRHFETFGQAPYYSRPPGVEGFLPIGALVSFKGWLTSGRIDPVHPAALVLFVTILALALLARNAFCSWICPVGTLSDGAWRLGRRLFGRTFTVWPWLDRGLRGIKYLLLLFFLKTIVLDMPAAALQGFLASPYWAVADVRMLRFFTAPSGLTLAVVGALLALSLLLRNAWCRYLCPYGALLGLLGFFSPVGVRRDPAPCTDCQRCSRLCPSRIAVHGGQAVRSVECTACLTCVANCPAPGALAVSAAFWRKPIPGWTFALLVLLVFGGGITAGILGGHWESSLTYRDFQLLIPNAARFGH